MVGTAVLVHLNGSLRQTLSRLSTLTGFAAFALLWLTTWFATRAGLRQMGLDGEVSSSVVLSTTVAGGWNGLYFFAAALVPASAASFLFRQGAGLIVFLLMAFPIGGVLAFTIGSLIGLLYGLVDSVLLEIAVRLVRWVQLEAFTPSGK
jgi:hypothetical protein